MANSGDTRYELSVPVGVHVSATTASGNINVSGTRGPLTLESASGDIDASDGAVRVEAENAAGRVTLQRMSGTTSVNALNGVVTITEITGDLEIEAVSGSIRIDRADLKSLRFEAVAGSLDFGGTLAADGRHSMETMSGSITLRVPDNFAASIEFDTFTGSLRPGEFRVTMQPGGSGGRGRNNQRTQFVINGGGARLSIKTFSGDVFLRKLGAAGKEDR